jgi:hypothetical protein
MATTGANRSNRWEVAAELNQRVSGKPFPFWGYPVSKEGPFDTDMPPALRPFLSPRKLHPYPSDGLQEFHLIEKRAKGAQPAWKLCFPGSVGSQALTGIPVVAKLRADPKLAARSLVWPFETGLNKLPPRCERCWLIMHAEIYPPLIKAKPNPGEVRDRAQVRELALYFAQADQKEELNEMFAGPPDLSDEQRRSIEAEEGWILGVR